jgi:hypothetical protein
LGKYVLPIGMSIIGILIVGFFMPRTFWKPRNWHQAKMTVSSGTSTKKAI